MLSHSNEPTNLHVTWLPLLSSYEVTGARTGGSSIPSRPSDVRASPTECSAYLEIRLALVKAQ